MDVFSGWSGERSRVLAEELADLLKRLLHPIRPWMSDQDIEKGQLWLSELLQLLAGTSRGIICVTPENADSPWLLFEAGALSKALDRSRVCPLLLAMERSDLHAPLAQFQATVLTQGDVLKLLAGLNSELGKDRRAKDILEDEFREKWPRFEDRLKRRLDKVKLSASAILMPRILSALVENGLPEPVFGQTAHFAEGFESHAL